MITFCREHGIENASEQLRCLKCDKKLDAERERYKKALEEISRDSFDAADAASVALEALKLPK